MNSHSSEGKRNIQTWIEELSSDQIDAVAPFLQAFAKVLSAYPQSSAGKAPSDPVSQNFVETLEQQLEKCSEILHDPQALQPAFLKCLEFVRAEKMRLEENVPLSAGGAIKSGLNSYPLPATADAVTGLPGRLPFQRTVSNALTEGKEAVVALFAVERLAYLNKRFGRTAGDEILLFVAQYLAQELPDSSSLSRWSGPAFAALLLPTANIKRAAMQIRAISAKQLSKNIDSGGRSVMLPITCSCLVEELTPGTSPDLVFTKMDDFLSAHIND